jgi:carbonic anhydrase
MLQRSVLYVSLALSTCALLPAQSCEPCAPYDPPKDPWAELKKGNERFLTKMDHPDQDACRRICLFKNGQKPYAVILSCSDSRVPPEIVFDQGLGDLFVIRIAGNVASDEAIGSLEYSLEHFKPAPKLVVVMGHQKCGAAEAALGPWSPDGRIPSIINRILPSVIQVRNHPNGPNTLDQVVRENVRINVAVLKTAHPIVTEAVQHHGLQIVGGYYSQETGKFEEVK